VICPMNISPFFALMANSGPVTKARLANLFYELRRSTAEDSREIVR
jgi:hypothetical protein